MNVSFYKEQLVKAVIEEMKYGKAYAGAAIDRYFDDITFKSFEALFSSVERVWGLRIAKHLKELT